MAFRCLRHLRSRAQRCRQGSLLKNLNCVHSNPCNDRTIASGGAFTFNRLCRGSHRLHSDSEAIRTRYGSNPSLTNIYLMAPLKMSPSCIPSVLAWSKNSPQPLTCQRSSQRIISPATSMRAIQSTAPFLDSSAIPCLLRMTLPQRPLHSGEPERCADSS